MKKIDAKTGIGLLLLLGIVIGGLHGFYAASVNPRMHSLAGNELCNGPYISERIVAEPGDTILLSYKSRISRGSTRISITDPQGSIVYTREDSRPIFRQHSIRVTDDDAGEWTFELECERAEIIYEIEYKIKEKEE